jgi:hypothetical protein
MYSTTKLTVELGELIDSGFDIWEVEPEKDLILEHYKYGYEIKKGDAFANKFEEHFRFRQIGQETPERFRRVFQARWREVIPYYQDLYETVRIMNNIEDPFGNVDVTETFTEEINSNSSTSANSTGTNNGTNTHKFSDAPRGSIESLDYYLTEATVDNGNNTATSQTTGTGTGKQTKTHTFTKRGNQGVNTYAHDMKEFRETIINIEQMLLNEFNNLFLGVY